MLFSTEIFAKNSSNQEKIILAGGCFWGVEELFQNFEGVIATEVGYSGGFSENPEFVTAEDYEMWLKISRITKNLMFIDEILGNFTRHGASASSSVVKHLHAEISVVNYHAKQLPNSFATTLRLRHRQAKAYYSAGRSSSRGGQIRSALKYFVTAIKTSPLFVRSYAAIILLFVDQIKARVQ